MHAREQLTSFKESQRWWALNNVLGKLLLQIIPSLIVASGSIEMESNHKFTWMACASKLEEGKLQLLVYYFSNFAGRKKRAI